MTHSITLLSALVVAFAAGSAHADAAKVKHNVKASPAATASKQACYSAEEFEADQALRLHTELMVIGLKCQKVYQEQNPFGAYIDFTNRHRTVLAGSEKRLIGFYQRTAGGNATQRFDTFRTSLANEVSRRAATIGNTEYCEALVPLARQAAALSEAELRQLVADEKLLRLAHQRPCHVSAGTAAAGG